MWMQRDKLVNEISWSKVLDWVVIDGIIWVDILESEVKNVN